jgi:hypothetical protein
LENQAPATAILIDATVVRGILLPAAMKILCKAGPEPAAEADDRHSLRSAELSVNREGSG